MSGPSPGNILVAIFLFLLGGCLLLLGGGCTIMLLGSGAADAAMLSFLGLSLVVLAAGGILIYAAAQLLK